jgi:hypothetical protein
MGLNTCIVVAVAFRYHVFASGSGQHRTPMIPRRSRFDTSLGPKDADGYATVTSKGKKVRARNVCLPDAVDPRGPKGK